MMITRCPACGTMFNVVADQLKVSQGWVRCGQCSGIFDASLHLQEAAVVVGGAPAPSTHAKTSVAQALQPNDTKADAFESGFTDDFTQSLLAAIQAAAVSKAQSSELAESQPAPLVESSLPPVKSSRTFLNEEINAEESAAAAEGVSFVRNARRNAFWKNAWVRTLLVVTALFLVATMLVQVGVQHRDQLVTQVPQLRPLVQAICEQFGCQLGQLRKIDAVVIDSSTFTKVSLETYKLNFSIKNLGPVPVVMPSLEVTLTDTQDQPLLRRVLLPAQFGAGITVLSPGVDFAGSLILDLSAATAQRNAAAAPSGVAGYRLLAFYP
jgi:predicted Zn finger-like uncharacterized protein